MSLNLFWQSLKICLRAGSHYRANSNISNFWRGKNKLEKKKSQVQNIDSGCIRPTCWSQNRRYWLKYTSQDLCFLIRFHSRVWLFADFSARCMFLTLLSTAAPDFQPRIGRADFAGLAFMLLLAFLQSKKIVSLCHPFKLLPVTGPSHKNLSKNAAHISHFHWNNCKKRQKDRVKLILSRQRTRQNWTSRQSYFLAVI